MSQTHRVQFGRDTLALAFALVKDQVQKDWTTTRTSLSVPDGLDQFGVRFYLRLTEATVWLDDVRPAPALKTQR